MKPKNKNEVYPIEKAGMLDSKLRKWVLNPSKTIKPYISKGLTVLDFGCGSGIYSIEIARQLEGSGKVIAADLQQGMLDIVKKNIAGTNIEQYIQLHKCTENSVGLKEQVDLITAFHVVHEVPSQNNLFKEFYTILKPSGKLLIIEPKFLVNKRDFQNMIDSLTKSGWEVKKKSSRLLSRFISVNII